MKNTKSAFQLKEVIFIVIITSIITSITTGIIMYNQNKLTSNITYADLNKDENLKEFISVYAHLLTDYYENIDKKEMLESAISAMFDYLGEDYTTYLNQDQKHALDEKLQGEYEGIGISVINGNIIYDVFDDTPAMKAGLQPEDVIVKVNGEEITEENKETMVEKIKTSTDKQVVLTIKRKENEMEFVVEKKTIANPTASSQVIEENGHTIGYLAIESFSKNIGKQVENNLKKLESKNIESLIIDLRGNTGGYLDGAHEVASLFLEKGQKIYTLQEKQKTEDYYDETEEKRNYPIVILTNGGTASASEILTAALKDNYGAIQVGTTTYGKGKVQQTKTLQDGSMVKYTSALWLTPKGICIDEQGITPEYLIELDYNEETMVITDTQLPKALEILTNN